MNKYEQANNNLHNTTLDTNVNHVESGTVTTLIVAPIILLMTSIRCKCVGDVTIMDKKEGIVVTTNGINPTLVVTR